jgi:two-component system, cell cycle sensor histidine kinase and response regulator CckA
MTAAVALDSAWTNGRVREALATGSHTELLKALVEASPGSWFFTRMDATFAFVNQSACDGLGYTRDELMALRLFDVDPTMTPEAWGRLNTARNFKPTSLRTFHRRKDGSVFPVEAFASRIFLGDERVSVSHVVDVSEEALARQALAEKQHLLQSLLDNAPVVVWYIDSEGRFQLSEGSALSLVGLVPGQVVGMTVKEVFAKEPAIVAATERALKGDPVEGIFTVDNAEFEYRYLPQRDEEGRVVGATGVAIDITARRSAEQARRRLMTAFEQAEDSFLLLDREGRVDYVNAAFRRSSGMAKADMLGRPWPDLLPKGGGDTRSRAELVQAIADGTAWRGSIRSTVDSQDERVLQLALSPFQDREDKGTGNGTVTGFVASSRDITDQTRTEDRLRQVEKMDAVGQLAGGVAHDFNNLLQIVGGNADLCLQLDAPEAIRGMLVEIREAGSRAAALVKQLLSFSKNATEPRSVALDGLLDRMLPLLRRLLGEHILIQVGPRGSGLDVWGDESQLEQIFVNLCVNARDAMPQGGRLELQLSRCSIGVDELDILGLSTPGAYVAIEVTDTGSGMSDEIRRRIFEPFFTTKAPGVGTGLGLATVYAVAKRHGGSVEVWSQLGKGTRFRVLLRHAEQVAEMPRPSVQVRSASTSNPRLRVLLAENDPSVRKITQRFLVAAGHDVVEVGDGQAAVSRIKAEGAAFDLIVLDAIMPQVNGPEVYKVFRSLSAAPVLFVTGHDFNVLGALPHDRARGLLHKPFGASDLAEAIGKLFHG